MVLCACTVTLEQKKARGELASEKEQLQVKFESLQREQMDLLLLLAHLKARHRMPL